MSGLQNAGADKISGGDGGGARAEGRCYQLWAWRAEYKLVPRDGTLRVCLGDGEDLRVRRQTRRAGYGLCMWAAGGEWTISAGGPHPLLDGRLCGGGAFLCRPHRTLHREHHRCRVGARFGRVGLEAEAVGVEDGGCDCGRKGAGVRG